MGQTLRVIAGTDGGPWTSTLLNGGVAVPFPDDATFEASVWRGGDEASLFAPAVSWTSAADGTFRASTAASQTAALDLGVYRMQIMVVSGGATRVAFDGQLEVLDSAGTAAAPVAWCTFEDMLLYSHAIRSLLGRPGSSSTGFLAERAVVTGEFSRDLVIRLEKATLQVKTRQTTLHPVLRSFDVPDPTAVPPTPAALSGYLRAGGLILEAKAREIVARRAVAMVLSLQATGSTGAAYMQEAADLRADADALFRCFEAQIDTNNDGIPDMLIRRDEVIILPPGTSP